MDKKYKWAIIDENGNILEIYRMYNTAFFDLNKMKKKYLNGKLRIERIERLGEEHETKR